MSTAGSYTALLSALAACVLAVACSAAGTQAGSTSAEIAASGGEAAHTAPWFNPAWQWRQVVRVDRPDFLGAFPTGGAMIEVGDQAQPDLSDIRVATADGRVRPHVILSAQDGRVRLRFGLAEGRRSVYYIYYGNPGAAAPPAAGLPTGGGGIRLEMREYKGSVRNIAEFRTAFDGSDSIGNGARQQINDTANPFSSETTRCLARYEGVLRVPRSGDYGLRVKATGFASLLIDGTQRLAQTRALGQFTANDSVRLEQGDHTIGLYVFSRHPTSYIVQLQWRPPTQPDYEAIPPDAFPSDVGFSVVALQRFKQLVNAYFTAGVTDQARLVHTDTVLSAVRFRSLVASTLGATASCTWDFGDGETSTERNPEHTYRRPGTYTVTLTARDTLGFEDSYARTITLSEEVQSKMELVFNEQEERKIIRGDAASGGDRVVPLNVGLKFLSQHNADLTLEQHVRWGDQTVTVLSERLSDLMAVPAELEQLTKLKEAVAALKQRLEREEGAVTGPASGPTRSRLRAEGEGRTADSSVLDEAIETLEELCSAVEGGPRSDRLPKLKQATARLEALARHRGGVRPGDASETTAALARLHDLLERISLRVSERMESPLALDGFATPPVAAYRLAKTASSRLERELVLAVELPNLPGRFTVSNRVLYGHIEIGRTDLRVLLDTDPFPELTAHDPNLVDADGCHLIVKTTGMAELERAPLTKVLANSPRALRVAIVDNSLCPGGAGYDESKLFFAMLQQQLEARFPSRTVTVRRFATERDTLGHFPVKRMLEAGAAIEQFRPHAVVISLDQEDITANTPTEALETALRLLTNQFAARTRAKLVLVTPPPMPYAAERSKVFALALGRFALERNIELADVYEAVNLYEGDWRTLFLDDEADDDVYMMYMNAAGQRLVAETLFKAMLKE